MSDTYRIKIQYYAPHQRLDEFIDHVRALEGVERVDVNHEKKLLRVLRAHEIPFKMVQEIGKQFGLTFTLIEEIGGSSDEIVATPNRQLISSEKATTGGQQIYLAVDGMTCQSCEILIERKFKKLPGIQRVAVDAAKGYARIECCETVPQLKDFQNALVGEKYTVRPLKKHALQTGVQNVRERRPTVLSILGFFSLAIFVGLLFTKLGIFTPQVAIGATISLGAAFVFGLVASLSSCAATVGGFLISSIAQYRGNSRFLPASMFVVGRILSYALLGGLLGLAGSVLSPSPLVTGAIVLVAAFYMIVMGLDMLKICPSVLKRLLPRMPKLLAHRMMDAGAHPGLFGPFVSGAATFFIPCGFTQALQLYVLTTGSFSSGSLLLGIFALGTAPALLAIGSSFQSIKGKAQKFLFQFSGALVVLMGVTNVQNGMTITGNPISFDWLKTTFAAQAEIKEAKGNSLNDPNVTYDGKEQVVKMAVEYGGYSPSRFTLRAGVPTKWIVDGSNAGGCLTVLQAPQLGVRQVLTQGENVIAFTPQQPGTYSFSCSMGMYRGQIAVVPNS